jgi:photosystem II stability/assembly factor-like uncharacterized protein
MQLVLFRRIAVLSALLSAVGLGSFIAGGSATAAESGSARPAAGPQKTVTATLIARPNGTLAPGSKVSSSALFGLRVFTDTNHGFALASVGSAQYPAATADGGKTWNTEGPALHLNAAQAPLSVVDIGAAGRKTTFAWGTGQVIDATSDGGKHWYRALFQGLPVAVVRNPAGHLVAFVDGSSGGSTSTSGVTWQYVSKNGGRSWHYDTTIGGS